MSLVLTVLAVLHVIFGMNFLGSVFILNCAVDDRQCPESAVECNSNFTPVLRSSFSACLTSPRSGRRPRQEGSLPSARH